MVWATVRRNAGHLACPDAVLRLSLAAYAWPRYITLANASAEPLWASRGIGAGSTFAVHELMAMMLVDIQALHERWPLLSVHIHVGDIQMLGTYEGPGVAARTTALAWASVVDTVRSWSLDLALAKQATVASTCHAQAAVKRHLQGWAGSQARAAVLGHGLALRQVVAKATDPTARRLRKATRRYRKLGRLRPKVPSCKGRVVNAALLPALTYGAAIRGMPPSLERTLAKWEHAFTGILPRAAPRRFAVGVLGPLLPMQARPSSRRTPHPLRP